MGSVKAWCSGMWAERRGKRYCLREERRVGSRMCGASSDYWTNGGYIDVLFTCGECGFGSLGSWFYSREWI